jgi:hypothetical protein
MAHGSDLPPDASENAFRILSRHGVEVSGERRT